MMAKKRVYNFALPYHLSGFYCSMAVGKLESDGVEHMFPKALVAKIRKHADAFGEGVKITKSDLDSLSDEAWDYLKQYL